MDDQEFTPRTIAQVFGDRDQTQPSTWSSKPNETSKPKPSAKTRGLIGRLGLRYHPANSADLSSHQAMLVLLAEDVAMLPEDLLDKAIQRHVNTSPYMPKAADLTRLAREIELSRTTALPRTGKSYAHDLAASYNARGTRPDVEWFVNDAGEVKIRHR
jgi:hypothetical protein